MVGLTKKAPFFYYSDWVGYKCEELAIAILALKLQNFERTIEER
jgi:hypothetical protein